MGEGAAVKASRMAANSAGASRQQTAHGYATSFVYAPDPYSTSFTAGSGGSHVFELPDRGLWYCEIRVDIAWGSGYTGDPVFPSWSASVDHDGDPLNLSTDAGNAVVREDGVNGVSPRFSPIITDREFTVNYGATWVDLSPPTVDIAVLVRAHRLGDLPPGVT